MHTQSEGGTDLIPWQPPSSKVELTGKFGQRSIVLAMFAAILVLDQMTKWWAWHHASTARINKGGNPYVGDTVSAWYVAPIPGLLLDVLGTGLLAIAISVLWRRRHSLAVLISGSMMIGGWSSNLLDRVVLHQFTAPGSSRGAVDFVPMLGHFYNIADYFIICGTPLYVLAVSAVCLGRWTRASRGTSELATSVTHYRQRAPRPMSAFASAISVIAVAAVGVANADA